MKTKFTIKTFATLIAFVFISLQAFAGTVTFSLGSATVVNNGTSGTTYTSNGRYYLEQTGIGRLYRQASAASSISTTASTTCDASGAYISTTSSSIELDGAALTSKYVHIFYSGDYDITGIQMNAVVTTAGRTITGIGTFTSTGTYPSTTGNYTTLSTVSISGSTVATGCSQVSFTCTGSTYIPKNTYIAIFESGSGIQPSSLVITYKDAGAVAPAVTALSIAGTAGTVSATDSTIKVNLPYATYTKGTSKIAVGAISATTDSSSVTTQVLKGATDISLATDSFTVGDTLTYKVSKNSKTKTYTIYTSADVPAPTITAASSSITTQTVKGGSAVSTIIYKLGNATGATVSGLPSGVSYSVNATNDTLLIFGSPTFTSYPDSATFTVTATAISGYTGSAVTTTGKVKALDPSKKQILYITTLTTTDRFLNNLKANSSYAVTSRSPLTASAVTTNTYTAYDLIVLHESLTGTDGGSSTSELSTIKSIDKPLLNLKSYFYSTGRWGWGTPANGDTRAAINIVMKNHPIFKNVPTVGDSIRLYRTYVAKNIQPTTKTIGGYNLAQTSSSSNIAIHELPAAIRVGSSSTSKYLLISMLSAQSANVTDTALVLLNNACSYLIDSAQYVPSSVATLSSLSVTGYSLSPAFNADSITYAVTMPAYTSVIPTTTATATNAYASTVITNATAIGGNTTVVVTAEDGTTKTYTITISDSVSTGINTAAASAFKVYGSGSAVIVEGAAGATVSLVSVSGINLYTGKTTSTKETLPVSLEKGVYIVVVDGVAAKVLVK
jgi:hypothetical protein